MLLHSDVRIGRSWREQCRFATLWDRKVKSSGRVDNLISGSFLADARKCMSQFGTAPASSLLTTGVIAAYVLLEWVSFIHEYKGVPITPWNPGLGLVFGITVLFGARYAAVLFAGAVIAEIAVLRTNLWWPIIQRAATGLSPRWRAAISGSMPVSIGCAMLCCCWLAVRSVQL